MKSGALYFILIMGGGRLFQFLTKPWQYNNIIPEPYIMVYALGTYICARENMFWGLAASLSWYVGAKYWIFFQTERPSDFVVVPEILRCILQIVAPIWISLSTARARLQNLQRIQLLQVLSSAIPHKMNNLLMVIMGQTDLLRSEIRNPRQLERLTQIADATQSLEAIVKVTRQHAKLGCVAPELQNVISQIQETVAV